MPHTVRVPARRLLVRLPAPRPRPHRHPRRLRARRLRCLHGAARRRAGALLPAVRGQRRRAASHHNGGLPGGRMAALGPVQQAFAECHGLQCGFCTPGFVTTITAYLREHPQPNRGAGPRGDRWQPVPLHRLPEHRRLGAAGGRDPAGGRRPLTARRTGHGSDPAVRRTSGARRNRVPVFGEPIAPAARTRGWPPVPGGTSTTWAARGRRAGRAGRGVRAQPARARPDRRHRRHRRAGRRRAGRHLHLRGPRRPGRRAAAAADPAPGPARARGPRTRWPTAWSTTSARRSSWWSRPTGTSPRTRSSGSRCDWEPLPAVVGLCAAARGRARGAPRRARQRRGAPGAEVGDAPAAIDAAPYTAGAST